LENSFSAELAGRNTSSEHFQGDYRGWGATMPEHWVSNQKKLVATISGEIPRSVILSRFHRGENKPVDEFSDPATLLVAGQR
jgi:hypothetical protein